MKASEDLIANIKAFEGLRLTAYTCPAGVWTIGYGHTKGVKKGQIITTSKADAFLRDDVAVVERQMNTLGLPKLKQGQWDALVDFVFNLGIARLKSSTLLRKLKANPLDETIPAEFGRWVYSGKTKLNGLVKRRAWEAKKWTE